MKWSRQTVAIVALVTLWVLTAVWGIGNLNDKRQAETLLKNKYSRAFYETIQRTKNVEVLLSKALISASEEQMNTIFSDLWYNANVAQENLSQIPVSHNVIANTAKFLTQVGDYAYTLSKEKKGRSLTDEEWGTMEKLYTKAGSLNKELVEIEREAANGRFAFNEVKSGLAQQLTKGNIASADDTFRRLDTQLQELPVLLYDGPFSDQVENIEPRGLTGKTVTKDEAIKIARNSLDLKGARILQTRIVGQTRGKIPAYSIEFRIGKKAWQIISVDVSKKGGHLVYVINPREVNKAKLSVDEALAKAKAFLERRGLKNMVATYTLKEENILTISYAWKQNDVIVYPDLIKLQVALDNGQIIGFDTLSYLVSHSQRSLPGKQITWQAAQAKLSPRVKVVSRKIVLVPTSGTKEKLSYEFKTQLKNDTFLVYIDAVTGEEIQILKLLQTSNGTLSL